MAKIPSDNSFDSTWELLQDPYRFIGNRCHKLHSNVVETRLLFRPTILMRGRDAAEIFYDSRYFMRKGAAPNAVRKTLFGVGAIQGTDEKEHLLRKKMFLSILSEDRVQDLRIAFTEDLLDRVRYWQFFERVFLFDELKLVLTKSACDWAGLKVGSDSLAQRTIQFASLFDRSNSSLSGHLRARWNRKALQKWLAEEIGRSRANANRDDVTAVSKVAHFRNSDDLLLDERTASVELINVVRPIVAVSVYMIYAVLALHQHPRYREYVRRSSRHRKNFIQEVRRFYPFFPAVTARVREAFRWNDYDFPKGRRVLLDLYSTNHDASAFESPEEFRPERFEAEGPGPFSFIPQGGGDRQVTHRCPGEDVVIQLTDAMLEVFINGIEFDLPNQDLEIKFNRLPAIPASGVLLSGVKLPKQS